MTAEEPQEYALMTTEEERPVAPAKTKAKPKREGRLKAAEACDQSGLFQELFIRRL
jgi:hypothetical protein